MVYKIARTPTRPRSHHSEHHWLFHHNPPQHTRQYLHSRTIARFTYPGYTTFLVTIGYPGVLTNCFFIWPGSLASLFLDSVEGFCAPAGAQKPSTLSHERAAGARKIITH